MTQSSRFTFEPLPEDRREAYPAGQAEIVLHRRPVDRRGPWSGLQGEEFELASAITYEVDRSWPVRVGEETLHGRLTIRVPRGSRMPTDLTSVPTVLTWLVPKSGAHLPAALLHDGLYPPPGEQTYVATVRLPDGSDREVDVDRIDADEVFREAMANTGVGVVRRWLVWAAVASVSLLVGPGRSPGWGRGRRLYHSAVVVATFALVGYLGLAATLDLLDREVAPSWWLGAVPWIPEGGWWEELLAGAAGAVVVPMAPAVLWLRYWPAGLVACLALATLLHVTVALLLVAGAYQAADLWVSVGPSWRGRRLGTARTRGAALAGVVLLGAAWVLAAPLR